LFDFSNLKPEIIAQFWIYFIVSFIGGVLIGWLARFFLLKIEKSTLNAEKKLFEAEKGSFKDYESLKNQYESLLKDLEKNEEYWVYKKNVPESHDVVDPSVLLQNELKKKN
jgi:uncharacterized membrane-anchored protein YhcB (DUF1043 family)